MISYSRNGDGTGTITIELSGDQDRVELILEKVAKSLHNPFDPEEKPWADYTSQEKLDLIFDQVKSFFRNRAKSQLQAEANEGIDTPQF